MATITLILRLWFAVVLFVAPMAPRLLESVRSPAPSQGSFESATSPSVGPLEDIRISQVFGGGGLGAVYPCDVIELFNATPQPISLAGWSIQGISSGTGNLWRLKILGEVTIAGYGYLLIGNNCSAGTTPTPPPDMTGAVALGTADGKVAVAKKTDAITGLDDPAVADFVGYGAASAFEGAGPAPRLTVTTAALRKGGGCIDSNDNQADFEAGALAFRNSYSPPNPCPETDTPPAVLSTSPAKDATGVARNAVLTVDFSEPVTLNAGWFDIRCDLAGTRDAASAAVTGGPQNYTIDLDVDLFGDDACRLAIHADAVHDQGDPPNAMSADYIVDFRTEPGQCGDPAYLIHDIQGAGSISPATGQLRTVEGVVTADFQGAGALSGYFLQEETSDADTDVRTSEGIFVDEHAGSLGDVTAGSRVRLTGVVGEVEGMTSLLNATRMSACGAGEALSAVDLTLPLASVDEWEQYEAMLVRVPDRLTVADSAELGSKGRLTLVLGAVPRRYTQENTPDRAGFAAWESDLARRSLILDDGSEAANPDPIRYPPPGLSAENTVRTGDAVEAGLTAIVDGRGAANILQPTAPVIILSQNGRPPAPGRAAGNIRVAFLSLDDYFNTMLTTGGTRGASSAEEFARQREKLGRALAALDADVIAVSKLENNGFGPEGALADLVTRLNQLSTPGMYAAVNGQALNWGSDEVSVGILYRASAVIPIGAPAMLKTGAFDQLVTPIIHRAPMIQTFEEEAWGERFTVAVNEWHGKRNCPVSGPDADAGDGQGCWNSARTAAADELRTGLGSDPTGSGDPDFLILGELNAFRLEDPIRRLTGYGYVDLLDRYLGAGALTTLTGARAGYADHALASATMALQVVGASAWAINAEEPAVLDYRTENKSTAQQTSLYAADPYRSSDQNPIVVDLSLLPDRSDLGGSYGTAWHTGQGVWRLGQAWGGGNDGVVRGEGSWNDGQGELIVSVQGPAGQYGCLYAWLDFSDGTTEPGVTDHPDGDWDANEQVVEGLALAPADAQQVTFPLPAGVIDGSADAIMRFRLIPAPEPLTPECQKSTSMSVAWTGLGPVGRADGGEVEDYIFPPSPLAVEMGSFTAQARGNGILLEWQTISEEDALGFNLYRKGATGVGWDRLNEALIAAQTPGAGLGHAYEWPDPAIEPGRSYAYQLEEINLNGKSRFYGPVEATATIPDAVKVRLLSAVAAGRNELRLLAIALLTVAISCLLAHRKQ